MYRSTKMSLSALPVIDIAPFLKGSPEDARQVVQAVGQACEEIGFLTITGHGVPEALVNRIDNQCKTFFDLPLEEKLKVKRTGDIPDGVTYQPMGVESLAASLGNTTPADLKESLDFETKSTGDAWPATPSDLRTTFEAYFQAVMDLSTTLRHIFALALDLPQSYFDDRFDNHVSSIRVINYPDPGDDPLPGQLRAGAHSDYDFLTILHSENSVGGVQVRNRAGEWINVVTAPNSFVVNIGDLVMRWTNDRWISTLHRVVNPPADQRQGSRRQSIVFFQDPNPDTVVTCLESCCSEDNPAKYPPIISGEYADRKHQKAHGEIDILEEV